MLLAGTAVRQHFDLRAWHGSFDTGFNLVQGLHDEKLSSRAKSRDPIVLPQSFATGFLDSASLRSK
jgi:hypothetical protein